MSNETESQSVPYATYKSFSNFINSLRETTIPSRIDRSVFGNMSGGAAYSILASLRALNLIEDNGKPCEALKSLVKADEKSQKGVLQQILKMGYPSLWDGSIDLATASAGQFDDHVRDRFGVKGSTVDKVAAFFLSAAEEAGIALSPHLKNRKATAPSGTSKRSAKARKQDSGGDGMSSHVNPPFTPPSVTNVPKALEYQLIDLLKGPSVDVAVRDAIFKLVEYLSDLNKNGDQK